jgi:hypothetical protein
VKVKVYVRGKTVKGSRIVEVDVPEPEPEYKIDVPESESAEFAEAAARQFVADNASSIRQKALGITITFDREAIGRTAADYLAREAAEFASFRLPYDR